MTTPVAISGDALLLAPGSSLGGQATAPVGWPRRWFAVGAASTPVVAPPTSTVEDEFPLPDLYDLFPLVIRNADQTTVPRDDVPLYTWDSFPQWETGPYQWSELIGPEPILQTTTRVLQIEFERTAVAIRDLTTLLDIDNVREDFLTHVANMLGVSLPGVSVPQQRLFLKNLASFYNKKGTPLVLQNMFLTLGFTTVLTELYNRRADAVLKLGPQIAMVASSLVVDEVAGQTDAGGVGAGPYTFVFVKRPLLRGSVSLAVGDQDTVVPTVIEDDGEGGWKDGVVGTVEYELGRVTVTLAAGVPANDGEDFLATYHYFADPFPDPFGSKWTDKVRSSHLSVELFPIDPLAVLSQEDADRVSSYLEMVRPAHVVFDDAVIVRSLDETATPAESIDVHAIQIVEHVFEGLYRGYGWGVEDNGSQHPSAPATQHRSGAEFLTHPGELAPYTYPLKRTGLFHNQLAAGVTNPEWIGVDDQDEYDSEVTNDIAAPTTTNFAIQDNGALPGTIAAGPGNNVLVMTSDNPAALRLAGEWSVVTAIVDMGAWWDITVSPALPLAPEIGQNVKFLQHETVRRDRFTVRPIENLDMYWVEFDSTPNGILLIFSDTATNIPALANHVRFRFTYLGVVYEETDDGIGGFSNTSTFISSASINYGTGAFAVTFIGGKPPDNGTTIDLLYGQVATIGLGDY